MSIRAGSVVVVLQTFNVQAGQLTINAVSQGRLLTLL